MTDHETMSIVSQVGEMTFEGNIIPHAWYRALKYPSGKPYLMAMTLLAEIVYWYRPRVVHNPDGSTRLEKKFKGDMLQRTYDSLARQFGFAKRETIDAVKYLVREGLVTCELRTITLDNGRCLRNVLYLAPVPARLREISHDSRKTANRASAQTEGTSSRPYTSVQTEVDVDDFLVASAETELHDNTSIETEEGLVNATQDTSAETEESHLIYARASVSPDGLRANGAPSLVAADAEAPSSRGTNTETGAQEIAKTESEPRPQSVQAGEGGAPVRTGAVPPTEVISPRGRDERNEAGRARFPFVAALDDWCRRALGKALLPPAVPAAQVQSFEEALARLDASARTCGQTAMQALIDRLTLRAEVRRQLDTTPAPFALISRQLAFALEDYAARAARQGARPAATVAPLAPEPAPRNARPEWMSDEEWAFHLESERLTRRPGKEAASAR